MSTESIIRDIAVNRPIHCIYFYYLKYPEDGSPQFRVYYQSDETTPIRNEAELKQLIKKLARNAKVGDFVPPHCGTSFRSVPWRRRSYIVIFVDDERHAISDPSDVSIDFEERREEVNHSFFNARVMEIDLSDDESGAMITVFHCHNLMRHKSGREMKDEDFPERYTVVVHRDCDRMLVFDEDGGTNQGGPIPPFIDV